MDNRHLHLNPAADGVMQLQCARLFTAVLLVIMCNGPKAKPLQQHEMYRQSAAPLKIHMESENQPFVEENHLPNFHFGALFSVGV